MPTVQTSSFYASETPFSLYDYQSAQGMRRRTPSTGHITNHYCRSQPYSPPCVGNTYNFHKPCSCNTKCPCDSNQISPLLQKFLTAPYTKSNKSLVKKLEIKKKCSAPKSFISNIPPQETHLLKNYFVPSPSQYFANQKQINFSHLPQQQVIIPHEVMIHSSSLPISINHKEINTKNQISPSQVLGFTQSTVPHAKLNTSKISVPFQSTNLLNPSQISVHPQRISYSIEQINIPQNNKSVEKRITLAVPNIQPLPTRAPYMVSFSIENSLRQKIDTKNEFLNLETSICEKIVIPSNQSIENGQEISILSTSFTEEFNL